MNITSNLTTKIATIGIAAALTIGGGTAAFAGSTGDGTTTGGGKAAKIEALCEHKDEIVSTLTERQTNISERITKLQAASTKATTAGHAKLAAKIDKRIATLQQRLDKVGERISKAPTWIAEHCD